MKLSQILIATIIALVVMIIVATTGLVVALTADPQSITVYIDAIFVP